MQYLKNLELFLESLKPKSNTSLITDLCISMLLINPNFLDNILDKGIQTRYVYNNSIFLTDLKNLLFKKNKLKLGIKEDNKYIEEDNIGKINNYFNQFSKDFDISKDYNKLNAARDIARNIQDKLLLDEKLIPDMIRNVYWVSPNKDNKTKEDIIIEMHGGKQYPIVINSKAVTSRSKSFNTLLDILLEDQADKLYSDEYLDRWDNLTKRWFKLIYNTCKNEYKIMIDQFIDASRVDSLTYFEYQEIEISDPKYEILGKYFPLLDKNYKELSKLMSDIWKKRESAIDNYTEVEKKWNDIKKVVLNNKIIEHLFVEGLNKLIGDDEEVEETTEGYLIATDRVKMRLLRVIVDTLNVSNMNLYYIGKNNSYHIPSTSWFRENYDRINIEYDYHQKLSEDKDSQFRIKMELDKKPLLSLELFTGFSGGEMSNRLTTKMKVQYESDFNIKVKY